MSTEIEALAETSEAVAATSSRKEKSELLAACLGHLDPGEIEPAIGLLLASPRQGAIGVGFATVSRLDRSARSATADPAFPPTVSGFDALLTAIDNTRGRGSEQARTDLLQGFLQGCSARSTEFVKRVLIGEARQGALAGVMVDAVAKAAGVKLAVMRRAVMLQGDLGQAAVIALTQGRDAVAGIDLVVGRPVQPMLASTSASAAEAIEAVGLASVEWKLDGARIQVHFNRSADPADRVRIVTRNLNDITSRLSPVANTVAGFDCESVVLDGEIIGRNAEAFQDTMSAFSTEDGSASHGLRPHFFDLLYLDDKSMIDEPLSVRLAALHRVAGTAASGGFTVNQITTADPAAAQTHLGSALAAGHEGVMVKAIDSRYEAGRRGKSWRKVKPVYTFDLVVLAAEWGYGRRTGKLSNLHLGALGPDGELIMVGKTFKGLTDELLAWQTETFQANEDTARSEAGMVAVAPRFVVEIAVDGVQTSTRYPGGVALRFARVKRYRPDKTAAEADTISAVQALKH